MCVWPTLESEQGPMPPFDINVVFCWMISDHTWLWIPETMVKLLPWSFPPSMGNPRSLNTTSQHRRFGCSLLATKISHSMLHDSKRRNTIGCRFSVLCSEHGKNHVTTNCQESDAQISCASSEREVEEVIDMDMFSIFFIRQNSEDHQRSFACKYILMLSLVYNLHARISEGALLEAYSKLSIVANVLCLPQLDCVKRSAEATHQKS